LKQWWKSWVERQHPYDIAFVWQDTSLLYCQGCSFAATIQLFQFATSEAVGVFSAMQGFKL